MTIQTTSQTILIVDDEEPIVRLLTRLLTEQGFQIDVANDGEAALQSVGDHPPSLILLDVKLPGMDGFEVCRRLKSSPATRLTPVVLLTGLQGRENRLAGINAGADDYLLKPFDFGELRARIRSLVRMKRYTDALDSTESIIASLALTVEARDTCTEGHSERLARYASALGARLGFTSSDLDTLRRGGILHDVGKIGIPDSVLLKKTRLTGDEYEVMKRHTIIGESLCGNLRSLAPMRAIIRHHHERLDGGGYPDGLRGQAVPVLAHVVGIVDAFDAMTTNRPYRLALTVAEAFRELRADAARGAMNAEIVESFITTIQRDFDGAPIAERRRRHSVAEQMLASTLARQVPDLSLLPDVHDRLEGLLADSAFTADPAAKRLPPR
ncbi:MAG: HD domain-containing phosphohydrolase [Acidobacteriota bacterium]